MAVREALRRNLATESPLAYYTFEGDKQPSGQTARMLSSLALQLCNYGPKSPTAEAMRSKEPRLIEGNMTPEAALIACVKNFTVVYIVIDALDKCETWGNEQSRLLKTLDHLISATPRKVNLLCTSLSGGTIGAAMQDLINEPGRLAVSLSDHEASLRKDMETYIDSTLSANE